MVNLFSISATNPSLNNPWSEIIKGFFIFNLLQISDNIEILPKPDSISGTVWKFKSINYFNFNVINFNKWI